MCGIQVAGGNRFRIAPQPGGHFTYAKASYRSVYGTVESGWRREEGKTLYTITVPANCTAEVVLAIGCNGGQNTPDSSTDKPAAAGDITDIGKEGIRKILTAGTYTFEIKG